MSELGILGGTFDPIHNGHMYMAYEAKKQLGLDKVIFIPTGKVPHKDNKNITDSVHRYNMVCCAVNEFENYIVSDTEVKRDGVGYTFETLAVLKEQYKNDKLHFIVGADSFLYIDKWRNPAEIFKLASVTVIGRNTDTNLDIALFSKKIEEQYNGKVELLKAFGPDISSTLIREKIKSGESIKDLVPQPVLKYINDYKLYTEF